MEQEVIECNFAGEFKVGDNIAYNTDVLFALADGNEGGNFNKMVVLQCGSIVEASLQQIIFRAANVNLEGVPNLRDDLREMISDNPPDKFKHIINVLQGHGILNDMNGRIYDRLHDLRSYRNKCHIQLNCEVAGAPIDEIELFSDELAEQALQLTKDLLSFLNDRMPRPSHATGHVRNLVFPASAHP